MYNSGKVIIGIIIFLVLVTFPFWRNAGKAAPPPKLEVGTQEKNCVESKAYMRAYHMDMLNTWRDEVVRSGKRELHKHHRKDLRHEPPEHVHQVPREENRVLRPVPQLPGSLAQVLGLPPAAG